VNRSDTLFAWHGWQLRLPASWNPVKLEGDYDQGFALIADLDRAQLGLRWRKVSGKRFDSIGWGARALRGEVGRVAADEAKLIDLDQELWGAGGLLYLEPSPPGRDVFVAHSLTSRRVIEIVYHAQRRDPTLAASILPALSDSPPDQPMRWSVFDLSCTVPAQSRLASHRLNAGDLSLTFDQDGGETLTIRQIALAQIALRRLPLERWLAQQERAAGRRYKPAGDIQEISVGSIEGVARTSIRRRRFGLLRRGPPRLITYALHHAGRDRLVLLQGSDETTLNEVAQTVVG
jgi:hypothetical protein